MLGYISRVSRACTRYYEAFNGFAAKLYSLICCCKLNDKNKNISLCVSYQLWVLDQSATNVAKLDILRRNVLPRVVVVRALEVS